ncbi:hypothetical protein EDEG_04093 [Edhazardia aedis USNM 41457]|uniref:Transmembrane protein n=1 Tax=Edhazardia aedis (strain USNM 41457) TaxID=1003232 RepID=J9DC06_EDHAE|nr:hypothetical protein EDEG_04093 [Edhazardia aedis USNM 41457]|eukprot:EJW05266.1 hypothetical protein EDEG_04093 [Edhazardia aedis USNM 41457]
MCTPAYNIRTCKPVYTLEKFILKMFLKTFLLNKVFVFLFFFKFICYCLKHICLYYYFYNIFSFVLIHISFLIFVCVSTLQNIVFSKENYALKNVFICLFDKCVYTMNNIFKAKKLYVYVVTENLIVSFSARRVVISLFQYF